MTEQLLQTKGGLRAHLYHSDKVKITDLDEIFICAPGMPNFPEKDFFEPLLIDPSVGFIVVYYYGYWFSSKNFTIQGCTDSIVEFVNALFSGELEDTFTGDFLPLYHKKVNLIGYSFGANPVLRAIDKILTNNINNIILAAPLALVNREELTEVDSSILTSFYDFNKAFVDFLYRGYTELLRDSNNELADYFNGVNKNGFVNLSSASLSKIYIYYGSKDKMVSKDMVDVLAKRINPKRYHIINNSGHSKELIEIALSELRQ